MSVALHRLLARAVFPLAYLLAGPLSDRVFEPLLAEGGALAGSIGRLIGVGAGRGVALLLIITGLVTALVAAAVYSEPLIRRLERQLPDQPAVAHAPRDAEISAMGPL